MGSFRRLVYRVLVAPPPGDRAGRAVQILLIAIILLNVAAVMADTVNGVEAEFGRWLWGFEVFSVVLFTVEYLLRAWAAVEDARFRRPVLGRVRHAFTFFALVDLAAILPFYVPMLIRLDLRFLRVLRLLRLARLLKIGRYSEAMQVMRDVLRDRKEQLLATLLVVGILTILSGGLMYLAEHDAQPDRFSSMPEAVWWAVTTVTTIGYGDLCPVTPFGKIATGLVAVLGIGLFALPAGILGSGFIEKWYERRAGRRCPHCGKPLDDRPRDASPPNP